MNELKGKVAVVTGGSRGIGRGIVKRLAALGCDVAFSFHQSHDLAFELKEEIKNSGVRCMASQVDNTDFMAVKEWINQVGAEFGRLDVLINNAGIIKDKPLVMMTEDDWKEVIDTNLNGMFNASRACIFTFLKQKHGNIINISSVSGVIGLVGQTNYSASKGGMNAFTKALAKEVASHGIRVNAICPGFIETEIMDVMSAQKIKEIAELIPLKRVGHVEDVVQCVEFLLSERAQYITGQLLVVDGGLSMRP